MRRATKGSRITSSKITTIPGTKDAGADGRRMKNIIAAHFGGEISLHGFLRRLVLDHTKKPVDNLTNPEKAAAIAAVWRTKMRGRKSAVIAHKFVLSLAPETVEEMRTKNISVDDELHDLATQIMLQFQQKFYPCRQLGYMIAVSHDSRQTKARTLIYPETWDGEPVTVADDSPVRFPDGTIGQVDFQRYLSEQASQLGLVMYLQKVHSPRQSFALPETMTIQDKLLSEAAWQQCRDAILEEMPDKAVDIPQLIKRTLFRRREFDTMWDPVVRPHLESQYERRANLWVKMTKDEAEAIVAKNQNWAAKIGEEIADTYTESSLDHLTIRRLQSDRRSISKEAFRANNLLVGWRNLKWGGTLFADHSSVGWWEDRVRCNDELAKSMQGVEQDIESKFEQNISWRSESGSSKGHKREQMAVIQRMLARMQKLRKTCNDDANREIDRLSAEKEQRSEWLTGRRLLLRLVTLNLLNARAKITGMMPSYLKQYHLWTSAHRTLPVEFDAAKRSRHTLVDFQPWIKRAKAQKESAPATPEDYRRVTRVVEEQPKQQISAAVEANPNKALEDTVTALSPDTSPPMDFGTMLDRGDDVVPDANSSHIPFTPDIAPAEPLRSILAQKIERASLERALDHHRNAVAEFLSVPRNDRIARKIFAPVLAADDVNSFSQVEF